MPSITHPTLRPLRLLLIVFVVLIHANPQRVMATAPRTDSPWHFVRSFIDPGLTVVAVPMFALLSGYLFFLELPLAADRYLAKIRRRLRTLGIPYLACAAANLGILILLQSLPATQQQFSHDPDFIVADFGVEECVRGLFIQPIPIQLWFLRDLIVLVALSPVIGLAISKLHWWPVLPFMAAWIVGYASTPDSRVFLATSTTAFFMGGAYLAIHAPAVVAAIPRWRRLLLPAWILLAGVIAWGGALPIPFRFLVSFSVFVGIPTLWYNGDVLCRWLERGWLEWLLASSFFIYLAHQPLMRVLERFAHKFPLLAQRNELFLFLALPAFTIALCAAVAVVLRRVAPWGYRLLTGDR